VDELFLTFSILDETSVFILLFTLFLPILDILCDDFPSDSFVAVQHFTVVVVAVNGARRKPGR
jgi:hypothetical protein